MLRLAPGRQGRDRRGLRQGGPCHQAGPDQQPAGPQRDGAARRDRRVRPRHRRLYAVDDQPESARHPTADGRFRARHSRTQAPRHRPGCRRRLRLQDLPLRRGSHRHLGVEEDRPPDQVGGGTVGELRIRRPWPRPRHPRRTGAGRGRQVPGAPGPDARQHGRLSVHLRAVDPDLPLRHAAGRPVHDSGDLRRGQGGLHPHRPGRCLSRRRPAGSLLPDRAHRRERGARAWHRQDGAAPPQLHPAVRHALRYAGGAPVRLRLVREEPGSGACPDRLPGLPGPQGGSEGARQAARHRARQLYRSLRHRPQQCRRSAGRPCRALRVRAKSASTRPAP